MAQLFCAPWVGGKCWEKKEIGSEEEKVGGKTVGRMKVSGRNKSCEEKSVRRRKLMG